MRLYLDTNILVFLITRQEEEISNDVLALIQDYENTLLVCPTVLQELIQLMQIGKLGKHRLSADSLFEWVENIGLNIIPTEKRHLATMANLPMYADHRDPADRLIIAQAISDRIPLVSSDLKFSRYAKHGLNFIQNKR